MPIPPLIITNITADTNTDTGTNTSTYTNATGNTDASGQAWLYEGSLGTKVRVTLPRPPFFKERSGTGSLAQCQ